MDNGRDGKGEREGRREGRRKEGRGGEGEGTHMQM